MKADLHVHSNYSDGLLNIGQLDDCAQTKGLDIIAITDHDTVKVFKELKENNFKTKILLGVEISSEMNGSTVHILGYFYNNAEPPKSLYNYLEERIIEREKRVYETIEKLKKYFDIDLTYDEIAIYADGTIGRPHIAKAIAKKYNIPFNDIFDKYIGNGKKAYIPSTKIETKDAIKLLKENNALVVVAHPVQILNANVEDVIKLGVDGIEINYPEHNKKDKKKYYKLAKKYNLIVTGGSDYHGPGIHGDMADDYIEGKELEIFLDKLKIKIDD